MTELFKKNCHEIFHRLYGTKNNNKQQVDNFLIFK